MTSENAAPAEMPGEVERAFNSAARAMQRRFGASGTEEDIEAALSEFFAPILAEMREIANAQGQQRFANLLRADAAEARALAAEAALAAERKKAHYANGVAELAMKHRDEAEREALRDELTRLEAAAPLSARETARYLQVERRLLELDAAAIRAQGG